ncbi:hypothetical protein PVAND_005910 [Polypedilum vanderplanki]|uniref:O-acyltransferase WSD1 C-terminal domain-containing protein n=1 Tax=Polypedilum vanderplanki TaxID=319348 RepID=A0A9J6C2F0_POLVA|nr:hypothetical protein PVAND_005910 [Polypedilum vanderplanki]
MKKKLQKRENSFWKFIRTTFYFGISIFLLPFVVTTFSVVTFYHKIKIFVLSKRYKYLDFARSNTVRTLVDTSKNPGILHFLVKVKGKCDLDEIRNAYNERLLNKKDKNGKFLYPRLKTILISCWNQYAFIKNFDNFKIENHIIMGPTSFRSQKIDESNIQECISSVVSKYMSCENPPWQIKLIPLSDNSSYYVLIRIHHLILDEQKNLNIGDMMLIDRSSGSKIISTISHDEKYLIQTPLDKIIKTPENLNSIYEDIHDAIISRWNEFVLKHDSLEHHDGVVKKPTNLQELFSSTVITFLNTYIDYKQQSPKVLKGSSDPQLHFRFLSGLLSTECERRQLSFRLGFTLFARALHPFNIIKNTTFFILKTICIWLFLSPFYILRELNALRRFVFLNEEISANSFCGFILTYTPMCFGAIKEIWILAEIVFTAPRLFIEQFIASIREDNSHYLNSALCGRKKVTWSETIPVKKLHTKALMNQMTYSEIIFSTISSCLLHYFEKIESEGRATKVPSNVSINFRSVPFSYLYGVNCSRNGVIGIQLPIADPSPRQFLTIREEIIYARQHQIMSYLLSLMQIRFDFFTTVIPNIWLKLFINFLSKKYPISVSLVLGIGEFEPKEMKTYYNAEIEDVIFFRTPQSNNSTSITVQRFRDKIRMSLMCDSNIEMQNLISDNFNTAFYKVPVMKRFLNLN